MDYEWSAELGRIVAADTHIGRDDRGRFTSPLPPDRRGERRRSAGRFATGLLTGLVAGAVICAPGHEEAPEPSPPPVASRVPTITPTIRPTPPPTLEVTQPPTTTVAGVASWYRWRPGEAAAGPAVRQLLGRDWRGQAVQVCAQDRCATVRLTDWCQCYRGTPDERIIDLDAGTFELFAPRWQGKVRVEVMG